MRVVNEICTNKFVLQKAILIRSGEQESRGKSIATIHGINVDDNGKPTIGSGKLLTSAGLSVLVKSFVPEQQMCFIEDRVLACGVEGVMWWKAPCTEMVWFNTREKDDGIGARGGKVHLPGLIFFAGANRKWYVFAVKGTTRPNLSSPLFQAPFYNVYESGDICTGNADIPNGVGIADIDGYERGFFQSRFTHPNIRSKGRLTKFRGGGGALWKSLLTGRRKCFPESSLVPVNGTLGDLFRQIKKLSSR